MSKLLERRSIRNYDQNIKISKEEMSIILKEATTAPSSMNMQPWRFVVVESKEGKEKLRPILKGNLTQLETSAAMIVIFTDLRKYELAEKIYDQAVLKGLMPHDVKEKQVRNINNMVPNLSEDRIEKSGLLDCGLVAMQLMHIAREHGYDTCPIGGFQHDTIAKALGLDEKRYKPALIVSIGKRADDGFESTRLNIKDITTFM
ncbi:MAG: nitroreductase family protein [Tenericutes bacterium HGW-Tenericutes-3]|nr:MAG: nitroreductase family protein [Tenericutes bacterium HGW-Tenericutes-3]